MSKYFDKLGRLSILKLKNIKKYDLNIMEEYWKSFENLGKCPICVQLIRFQMIAYLNKYTLDDLKCKQCNNLTHFHNSIPKTFCSQACKANYQKNKKTIQTLSSKSRQKLTETKLNKLYGQNARFLLDKDLFIKEFCNFNNGWYIFNYDKALKLLNVRKGTLQKYIRKFDLNVKSSLNDPITEIKIEDILKTIFDEILLISKYKNFTMIKNDRKVLNGKEIDFYIREYNIGFEINGIYWHSYESKNISGTSKKFQEIRHFEKANLALEKNTTLFQINEDEINHKLDIWKSKIRTKFGLFENRYFARNCEVHEIDVTQAKIFLNRTHLQGYARSSIKLGLFYNKILVSVMTFGEPRVQKDKYTHEIIRFSSELNTQIIGGASKLFKYFLRNYDHKNILSYGNRRWVSSNNIYEVLGFNYIGITKPSYHYCNDRKWNPTLTHRSKYQKYKIKKLDEFKEFYSDDKIGESIMFEAGYRKIYDAGHLKYEYIV